MLFVIAGVTQAPPLASCRKVHTPTTANTRSSRSRLCPKEQARKESNALASFRLTRLLRFICLIERVERFERISLANRIHPQERNERTPPILMYDLLSALPSSYALERILPRSKSFGKHLRTKRKVRVVRLIKAMKKRKQRGTASCRDRSAI